MWTLAYIVLAIVAIIAFFKIKSTFLKYRAAMNALLAKHTFFTLNPSNQVLVIDQAKQIIVLGGGGTPNSLESLPDREKFGFYALAMVELGIEPAIKGYEWSFVRNPFVALLNADSQIKMVQIELERDHGVSIEL